MWMIEQRVGRLIEVRVGSPIALVDLEGFADQLADLTAPIIERGQRWLACTDLCSANVLPPEVADWFIRLMQYDNPSLERNAFLIGPSAVFALQIERMIKQGNSPMRRTFRETEPLIEWLGELLTASEMERVRQFLAGSSRRF